MRNEHCSRRGERWVKPWQGLELEQYWPGSWPPSWGSEHRCPWASRKPAEGQGNSDKIHPGP